MTQESEIRCLCFVGLILPQSFEDAPLGRGSQGSVVRKMNPTKKINAGGKRFYKNLRGVKR